MEFISRDEAIKTLYQKQVNLFDVAYAAKIFAFKRQNSLYKLLQRLEKAQIIKRITKGKYQFLLAQVNDFELANFLYQPSYLSLESALSFYGILPQFPYTITSVTPLKSKKIIYQEKEYEFAHVGKRHFWGFTRKEKFFIATAEKALLDELYFMAKGLRKIHLSDLDLRNIDKKKIKTMSLEYHFPPFDNLIRKLRLC